MEKGKGGEGMEEGLKDFVSVSFRCLSTVCAQLCLRDTDVGGSCQQNIHSCSSNQSLLLKRIEFEYQRRFTFLTCLTQNLLPVVK